MNQPLSLIDPTGEFWVSKNVGNGSITFRVKDSGAKATDKERAFWEGQGYTVYEDGAQIDYR
jgi:predicted NUDIX family NTP pyrophosphohydrolase